MATECAAEQGKFWEFTDKIYEVTPGNDGLDLSKLSEYAKEVGVKNISKFQSCVDSKKYADRVQRDTLSGEAGGVRGTPNTIIVGPNGETTVVSGAEPFASVEAKLQQYLK
jgi:protein-disulfide isomerase